MLVEHVERGEWLDLTDGEPVTPQDMRVWGADRTVTATVLRDIVRGVAAPNPDPRGLRLRGVRVTGRLDLAYITSSVPVLINDCLLEDGVLAMDAHLPALDLEGCLIEHPTDSPLVATGLISPALCLRNTTVTAACPVAVVLIGAQLDDLDCWGATITNTAGIALAGDHLTVRREALLGGGFTATSASGIGTVMLSSADIGELVCLDTTLRNDDGTALNAQNLRVHRALLMRDTFTATGSDVLGAVVLDGSELGELDCTGAVLTNESGPALSADEVRVRRDTTLNRCEATGGGQGAAISFVGAEVGALSIGYSQVRNPTGSAVDVTNLRTHRDLSFHDSTFRAGERGNTLNVEAARVGGDLSLSRLLLSQRANPDRRLFVDGLTYPALPIGIAHDDWLRLLREATPWYAAQPYQHLAAVHRASGHDSQARRVLMAQRRDQLGRAITGRAERTWVRFTGLVLGYGYQPWRALIGLLLVVAASVTLAVVLGGQGGLAATEGAACPPLDRVAVGFEVGTPLLNADSRCAITDTGPGQVLTVAGWALRLLAWAFATLFIAGFTSAVRRT